MEIRNLVKSRKGYAGLYVHFPFCIQKCSYCDFFSVGNGKKKQASENDIFNAYKKELEIRIKEFPEWNDLKFDTVFFGGGTPSRMDTVELNRLIQIFENRLNLTNDVEISLEANPEDITKDNLESWKEMGINRINMGYQTSHPKYLSYVGRYYDEKIYRESPILLAESGIKQYGYDLIYGFPGETMEEFLADWKILSELEPPHISIYSLTLEKGTSYSRQVREGRMKAPEEELQEEILKILPGLLRPKGYEWYEVSNYAKPGYHSRHNLKYWTGEPYLALGPSAHGFNGKFRYANPRNLEIYQSHPGVSKWEPADIDKELPLGLFRVFSPIEMEGFFQNFPGWNREKTIQLMKKWADQGYANLEMGKSRILFQWKDSAVLHLDEFILEFF